MENICCIIDMDGFCVNVFDDYGVTYKSEFFLRELGFIKVKGKKKFPPCSYRFDLRGVLNLKNCSPSDLQTVRHQSTKILGLPVYPTEQERPMDYNSRDDLLRGIYKGFSDKKSTVVAYKGGHREKEYLSKLEIPHINLESFGCPKFENLIKTYETEPAQCGYHTLAKPKMLVHCAEAEVVAYRDWVINNLE